MNSRRSAAGESLAMLTAPSASGPDGNGEREGRRGENECYGSTLGQPRPCQGDRCGIHRAPLSDVVEERGPPLAASGQKGLAERLQHCRIVVHEKDCSWHNRPGACPLSRGDSVKLIRAFQVEFTLILLVAVSYTHLRAHETRHDLVCRLL